MANRLESVCALIEARFLDASEVLSDAVDGIALLVAALDALTNAPSPATITATTEQLAFAAAKLSAMPAEQAARRAAIRKLEGRRAAFSAGVEDMRRSLAYMRAFTTSIKITARGIASADPEFHIFAQETSLRVEAGRQDVDALENDLFRLRDELLMAAPRAEALARDSAAMIPAVPNQLLASAAIMAEHRSQIVAAAAEAGKLAREVRKKVARILGALQIGDSTRQRVEHIQAGVKILDDIDAGAAPEEAVCIRAVLCALLSAQMDSTLADFSNDVAEISAGLEGLAHDAAALLGLRELAYSKTNGESDGLLRALELRVAAAAGLAAEIEQADALARDTGRQAASVAQTLSERLGAVQTMKSDVLYMALNTALKSARLGEDGRPLSIIASELRAHARHLEATATASEAVLKTLNETAAELSRDHGGARDSGAGAALEAAIASIKRAGEATEQEIATLAAQGEAVMQILTQSRQRLDFEKEIGGMLGHVARDLARQAAQAAGAAKFGADIQAPLAVHFAKLAATYTMVKEREIQAAIAAKWGIALPAPPARPAAAQTEIFEDEVF